LTDYQKEWGFHPGHEIKTDATEKSVHLPDMVRSSTTKV
jgi:hypothetical protein